MKRKSLIFTIFVVMALAGLAFIVLKKDNHNHPYSDDEQGKQKDIYYCPMHPQITRDKPGECPICYMKLVKREPSFTKQKQQNEEMVLKENKISAEGYASIQLTPQKQQLIGIKTAFVKYQNLTKTIRTVGTVAHDPELYQMQVEYIQAIKTLKQAQEDHSGQETIDQLQRFLEASRTRLKHMGISDDLIAQMAEWKQAQHSLLYTHPDQPIWIYAQIYQYEIPLIHIEDEVEVTDPSFSGEVFKGKIKAIDVIVDQLTRTTRVRILVEDHKGKLRPEMYVDVMIHINLGDTLAVPKEAVFDTGTQKIVFVDQGEGVLEPRNVVLGTRTEGFYEIKEGLKEGEKVVTSGNFLIDSESRLNAALDGMTQNSSGAEETMPNGISEKSDGGQHVH
ncbi:MAG: efflux RND transporter periplasmic adaptor subunit [Candidatus Omnitrophica bacterium]|nr:efflux RND transporter periplasmic adaptor subunit [Candidatus Omnitrophota bacterium]